MKFHSKENAVIEVFEVAAVLLEVTDAPSLDFKFDSNIFRRSENL